MQVLNQEREQRIYSNFIDSLRAQDTKDQYKHYLRAYMRFLHLWVEAEKKEDEYTSGKQPCSKLIDMPQDQFFESIKSFILDIRGRNVSTALMKGSLSAIKVFYEMNDVIINWKKLYRFKGEETEEHEDRAYSHQEIQTLLNVCDLRLKATVLLAASTGMRIGALNKLAKSHLEEKGECYKISVYKGQKGKGKYYTFCTPEARKAVDEYFQFRERHGEILGPDSPVFRKDFATEIPGAGRWNVEGLSNGSLARDIWKHLIKAGLREIDHTNTFNRKEVKATHGMRKFFDTQLIKADIHPHVITGLIGHSKKKLDQRYSRLTEDELFFEFQKAIDLLTVDPSQRLQKKVDVLQERNDRLDKVLDRIDKLEKEIGVKLAD